MQIKLDLRFKGMKIKACQAFTQNNISLFVFSKNPGKSAKIVLSMNSFYSALYWQKSATFPTLNLPIL
jgi:hypothetical protein